MWLELWEDRSRGVVAKTVVDKLFESSSESAVENEIENIRKEEELKTLIKNTLREVLEEFMLDVGDLFFELNYQISSRIDTSERNVVSKVIETKLELKNEIKSLASSKEGKSQKEERLDMAEEMIKSGDPESALSVVERVKEAGVRGEEVKGMAYLLKGDNKNALVCFRNVCVSQGDNVSAAKNMVIAECRSGAVEEAKERIRRLLRKFSQDPGVWGLALQLGESKISDIPAELNEDVEVVVSCARVRFYNGEWGAGLELLNGVHTPMTVSMKLLLCEGLWGAANFGNFSYEERESFLFEMIDILKDVRREVPSVRTFPGKRCGELLVNALYKNGQVSESMEILDTLWNEKVDFDLPVEEYSVRCSVHGRAVRALEMLDYYAVRGVGGNVARAKALSVLGEGEEAKEIIDHVLEEVVSGRASVEQEYLIVIAAIAVELGRGDAVGMLLGRADSPDSRISVLRAREAVRNGDVENVKRFYEEALSRSETGRY